MEKHYNQMYEGKMDHLFNANAPERTVTTVLQELELLEKAIAQVSDCLTALKSCLAPVLLPEELSKDVLTGGPQPTQISSLGASLQANRMRVEYLRTELHNLMHRVAL